MLTAAEYLGKVGVGATGPEFFRADDGRIYVVKAFRNCVGKNVLISETIAAAFGKRLNLPFPPGGPICLKRFWPELSAGEQLGFASAYIPDTVYATNQNILRTENFSAMSGVVLFDHLFHNADRANNRKNLLVTQAESASHFYAIDHSHLFRTGRWTAATLYRMAGQIKVYANFLYGFLLRGALNAEMFTPYLEVIRNLKAADIEMIVAAVPAVWFTAPEEKDACRFFIAERCRLADKIAACLAAKMQEKNSLKIFSCNE